MSGLDDGLLTSLLERGVTRRSFLKFCAAMTAALALPASYAPRVAAAVAAAPRLPVVWLRGQGCGGETEALLRAANPTTAGLLLDLLSVDYMDALMAPAAHEAESARTAAMRAGPNGYIAVVEGAVPTAGDGAFLTIGGRSFADIVRDVTGGAVATIALGSCAFDGGLSGAQGGMTGAGGVDKVVSGSRLVTLPGCPINVENLTATIVHYLTFKEMPATDLRGRPLFAYGSLIHNQCERRPHFEFGEFVQAWGDEGAQKGWCLYRMGCKGPESFANCPTARYGEGTSWPVKAGAGCIACTMPGFWDAMSPFSQRLPSPVPFAPDVTADQVGLAAIVGVGGLAAVHGAASMVRARVSRGHGPASEPVQAVEAAPAAGIATADGLPEPTSLPEPPMSPPAATPPAIKGTAEPAGQPASPPVPVEVRESLPGTSPEASPGPAPDPGPRIETAGAIEPELPHESVNRADREIAPGETRSDPEPADPEVQP